MLSTPFYFTRGGNVNIDTGSFRDVGDFGYAWSSTAATTKPNVYVLNFYSADLRPSYADAGWNGWSVR